LFLLDGLFYRRDLLFHLLLQIPHFLPVPTFDRIVFMITDHQDNEYGQTKEQGYVYYAFLLFHFISPG
jgi:hypothetical protein